MENSRHAVRRVGRLVAVAVALSARPAANALGVASRLGDAGLRRPRGGAAPRAPGRRWRWRWPALIVGLALGVPSTAFGSSGWTEQVGIDGTNSLASMAPARAQARTSTFRGAQGDSFSPDFYYDPGSPCDASICDSYSYSPNQDYYFDPGSSCDASICDQGYYNPTGDFYYDPGSSTDSNLIDTSSSDWSASGEATDAETRTPSDAGASPFNAGHLFGRRAASSRVRVNTFVAKARSYRLVYPRAWQRFTSPGVDFGARDLDGNAAVDALAVTVPAGQSVTFDQVLQGYFASLGATPVTGQEQSVSYLGDTRQAAEVEFYWNNTGVYGGTVVVMIRDHGRVYLLAGVVADLNSPSVRQDALHVSSVLSSLDVLHTIVVPKRLAARFADKTHSYRLTYARDWIRQPTHGTRSDLILRSRDGSAAMVSLSMAAPKHTKSVTAQNMRALVSVVGRQVGKVTGTPVYHAVKYKGVGRRMVSFTYRTPRGVTGRIFIVAALHHRRVCVVAGVVLNTATATINRDSARVSAMISSLAFA